MKISFQITPTLDRDKSNRTVFSEAGKYLGEIRSNGKGRFYTSIMGLKMLRGTRKKLIETVTEHFASK